MENQLQKDQGYVYNKSDFLADGRILMRRNLLCTS